MIDNLEFNFDDTISQGDISLDPIENAVYLDNGSLSIESEDITSSVETFGEYYIPKSESHLSEHSDSYDWMPHHYDHSDSINTEDLQKELFGFSSQNIDHSLETSDDVSVEDGTHSEPSFKGSFINDKKWNEAQAKDYEWKYDAEIRRAEQARFRGDMAAVKQHTQAANGYLEMAKNYHEAAKKCTK